MTATKLFWSVLGLLLALLAFTSCVGNGEIPRDTGRPTSEAVSDKPSPSDTAPSSVTEPTMTERTEETTKRNNIGVLPLG